MYKLSSLGVSVKWNLTASMYNGHAEYFGKGTEYRLGNGNTYALVDGVFYRLVGNGNTNVDYIRL